MLCINVVQVAFCKAMICDHSYFIVSLKKLNIFIEFNQCLLGKFLTLIASKYKKWRKCVKEVNTILKAYILFFTVIIKLAFFSMCFIGNTCIKNMKLPLSFSQTFFIK